MHSLAARFEACVMQGQQTAVRNRDLGKDCLGLAHNSTITCGH